MSLVLALIALLVAPAQAQSVEFDFVGQPDCVELSYTGEHTRLVNGCAAALLVDQSVHAAGLVMPGATVEVRDLSAFTIGMEGLLFRAVAHVVEPVPTPATAVADAAPGDTGE